MVEQHPIRVVAVHVALRISPHVQKMMPPDPTPMAPADLRKCKAACLMGIMHLYVCAYVREFPEES